MSKNLILFLLISFCSFSGSVDGKSIEESLNDLCDRISHCRSDEEKKSSIRIILDNSLYEFNYKDKNGSYKFYIPEDTEIVKGKNKNVFLIIYKTHLAYSTENIIVAELTKRSTSKFTFDTEEFERYVNNYLGNEVNSKDKILEFRKKLLDKNKNFIEEKKDIEYSSNELMKNLDKLEKQLRKLCPEEPTLVEETFNNPFFNIYNKFVFKNKDKEYNFSIPSNTEIINDKNSKDVFLLMVVREHDCMIPFEIAKLEKQPNSKFMLNTDELEFLLNSRNVENYENKVLEFRSKFFEENKNFIKEERDIEFETRKK